MKKIIIPLVVFFVITIGGIIFAVSDSYTKVQYEKDALFHMMSLEEGGSLVAEYDNTVTKVLGRNISRINKVITVSELKRLYSKPDWDENAAIFLRFSDGAEYIIAEDPSVDDGVFILYSYKNKKLRFKVNGYNSFDWAKKAISSDGIFNENEVLD